MISKSAYIQGSASFDPNDHARLLSGWDFKYEQISHGEFRGRVDEFESDEVQVIRDRSNRVMVKKGVAIKDTIAFCLTLQKHGDVYCSGHLIEQPCLMVAHSEKIPDLKVPEIVDILLITVKANALQDTLERQGVKFYAECDPQCIYLQNHSVLDEIKSIWNYLSVATPSSDYETQQRSRQTISDSFVEILIDLMSSVEPYKLTSTLQKRVVDKACAYAMENLDESFSIPNLCSAIGVSRRKLQYCFQDTLGINAIAYFRALKLNAVRRALQERGNFQTIQNLAEHWGFWHMGRFSSEYKAMFGERPSDTVRCWQGIDF